METRFNKLHQKRDERDPLYSNNRCCCILYFYSLIGMYVCWFSRATYMDTTWKGAHHHQPPKHTACLRYWTEKQQHTSPTCRSIIHPPASSGRHSTHQHSTISPEAAVVIESQPPHLKRGIIKLTITGVQDVIHTLLDTTVDSMI